MSYGGRQEAQLAAAPTRADSTEKATAFALVRFTALGHVEYYAAPGGYPGDEPVFPDRIEACVRHDYEAGQVVRAVSKSDEATAELVTTGGGVGISVLAGTAYFDPTFWQHTELRFYYEPDDKFTCWNDPSCDDFSNLDFCPPTARPAAACSMNASTSVRTCT